MQHTSPKRLSALRCALIIAIIIGLSLPGLALAANPQVKLITSLGDMVLELDQQKAPKTVANFLAYAKEGFLTGWFSTG
jgi:peptidyl-prolyl cis-trans isomerase A (cyclophilin A)